MKLAIVDRFEGTMAVLLIDEKPVEVPRSKLPNGTREGDYLRVVVKDGEMTTIERDDEATDAARKRVADKLDRLRRGEHLRRDDNP